MEMTCLAEAKEPAHQIDDYDLMRQIAARDQNAISIFYDRHSKRVYALGLRMLHDRGEAEDLLIEVFSELWNRADRYDAGRGAPVTYLTRLARSRAIDRRRQGNSRTKLMDGAFAALPTNTDSSASDAGNPFDHAVHDELRERIRSALQRLEPSQRQALELSYFNGLSHSEIAIRLDKPLGTIKSAIRLGLIRLRDCLRIYKD
jgi:RNA polymerase sigma-70 factor (ECF subfamily)